MSKELEIEMAQAIVAELIRDGRQVRLEFDGGECWLDLEPGKGADLIADYRGPDEVMIPLLEVAQNIVDR